MHSLEILRPVNPVESRRNDILTLKNRIHSVGFVFRILFPT